MGWDRIDRYIPHRKFQLKKHLVPAKLYNKWLAESCFPSCWKSSSAVPVFKNDGERPNLGTYHVISLVPIISKIFESFINDRLTKHLDITGLFSDLQYGLCAFRPNADILTVLTEHIYNSLDAGGETRAIELDISKHLIRFGMLDCPTSWNEWTNEWMLLALSYVIWNLFCRTVHWKMFLMASPLYITNAPQVSVLGPSLFLFSINDLPDEVLSRIGIYADDTTLYSGLGK